MVEGARARVAVASFPRARKFDQKLGWLLGAERCPLCSVFAARFGSKIPKFCHPGGFGPQERLKIETLG